MYIETELHQINALQFNVVKLLKFSLKHLIHIPLLNIADQRITVYRSSLLRCNQISLNNYSNLLN